MLEFVEQRMGSSMVINSVLVFAKALGFLEHPKVSDAVSYHTRGFQENCRETLYLRVKRQVPYKLKSVPAIHRLTGGSRTPWFGHRWL